MSKFVKEVKEKRMVKVKTNEGKPIISRCIVIINDNSYVDKDLKLTDNEEDAQVFIGKRKVKRIRQFLKMSNVNKVYIKEL